VEQRDKLLADARAEEAIQRSPGAAVALFYGVSARAHESGVAFAHPSENAVRAYFYGLTAPPEGHEYVVAARTKGGEAKALGDVVPGNDGTAFLLARDLPEGGLRPSSSSSGRRGRRPSTAPSGACRRATRRTASGASSPRRRRPPRRPGAVVPRADRARGLPAACPSRSPSSQERRLCCINEQRRCAVA
jgi:hypothetical protein